MTPDEYELLKKVTQAIDALMIAGCDGYGVHDFEAMYSDWEIATSGIRKRLQAVQDSAQTGLEE